MKKASRPSRCKSSRERRWVLKVRSGSPYTGDAEILGDIAETGALGDGERIQRSQISPTLEDGGGGRGDGEGALEGVEGELGKPRVHSGGDQILRREQGRCAPRPGRGFNLTVQFSCQNKKYKSQIYHKYLRVFDC